MSTKLGESYQLLLVAAMMVVAGCTTTERSAGSPQSGSLSNEPPDLSSLIAALAVPDSDAGVHSVGIEQRRRGHTDDSAEVQIVRSELGETILVERRSNGLPHGTWEVTTTDGRRVTLQFQDGYYLGSRPSIDTK